MDTHPLRTFHKGKLHTNILQSERADWVMLQWQLYKIAPKVATQIFDTALQVKLTGSRLMHWKNTLVEFLPFCTSESPLKTWLL